jgi:phenylalanyl-tRNA synthetase beta chain
MLKDKTLGLVGKIHPSILDDSYAFEINLEMLFGEVNAQEKFAAISKYPSISRDLAIVVDKGLEARKIKELITQTTKGYLTNLEVFDLYQDDKIGADKVSLGFRLTFNSPDKTLENEDVDKIMKSIMFRLDKELKAEIRQ